MSVGPISNGLNDQEVILSREKNGMNSFPERGRGVLNVMIGVILEPMFLLLSVACVLYYITGQFHEGWIMTFALLFVAGISVYQEFRSERALSALRKLTRAKVIVIRNGLEVEVPEEDVVVGDCLIITEGIRIPADASLVMGFDLQIDESILTGESLPVSKSNKEDILFGGTLVLSGNGKAIVTAVGVQSTIGNLGASIANQQPTKTVLQQQINHFVKYMAIAGAIAFLLVCFLNFLQSHDLLHSLFHGLTLAMAVVPEEIPVAVSSFLAIGAYHMIRKNVLVRHPQTVEALGAATVICVDKTGTITRNSMAVAEMIHWPSCIPVSPASSESEIKELIKIARLACEPDVSDPMEKALDEYTRSFGLEWGGFQMIREYPLSGRYPMMTHVYRHQDTITVAVKGAPEGILKQAALDDRQWSEAHHVLDQLAAKGYRILAVATASITSIEQLPEHQSSLSLKLMGFVGFSDPVKENIPSVLKSFHEAGISVKMITGDFPATACHVAKQAGIVHHDHCLTGEQINDMTDEQLVYAMQTTDIFARSMPDTKLRIIRALISSGEVVAMTGDGVNDGPALKAAHIGISMGKHGSEVARQSSSLVLLNDDLSGMVEAVSLGRKIYANLKKAIQYIVSIHIPVLSVVLLPLVLGWESVNLFNPIHIIFLELIMGPTCSIVFENEPVEKSIMKSRPRKFSVLFFRFHEFFLSIIQGIAITAGLMFLIYVGELNSFHEAFIRTLVFTTLIISNILLTLTGRSRQVSMVKTIRYKNRLMPIMLLLTLFFLIVALEVKPVRAVFGFMELGGMHYFLCTTIAFLSVLWVELLKITKG